MLYPLFVEGDVLLEQSGDIVTHIYSLYKELFMAEPYYRISPADDYWPVAAKVSATENVKLSLPFSSEEVGRGLLI